MRPWFLGLCVGFTLVTPLAKKLLAEARTKTEPCYAAASTEVNAESMPAQIEMLEDDEPTIVD